MDKEAFNDEDDYYSQSSEEQYRFLQRRQTWTNQTAPKNKVDEQFWFKTGPRIGAEASARMAIIGDLGVFNHTRASLQVLSNDIDNIDFVVMAGDISYANGNHRCVNQDILFI